jgi:hypothetical protein
LHRLDDIGGSGSVTVKITSTQGVEGRPFAPRQVADWNILRAVVAVSWVDWNGLEADAAVYCRDWKRLEADGTAVVAHDRPKLRGVRACVIGAADVADVANRSSKEPNRSPSDAIVGYRSVAVSIVVLRNRWRGSRRSRKSRASLHMRANIPHLHPNVHP